jgi:cyanophycinase
MQYRILCVPVLLIFALAKPWLPVELNPGALIVVGGGGTPPEVAQQAVQLAGGELSVVAILPQASEREERGLGSVEMFLEAGAGEAYVVEDLNSAQARADLERASLVWMPGGSQNRLMEAVRDAGLGDLLRAMHQRGVAFGGTSAGAAVQSGLMITGEAELEAVVAGGTELAEGLGLWPEVIVDQHALKRRRFQRLLSATLDHPEKLGIAVDEKTAVIFSGSRLDVMGASSVFVIDARGARVEPTKPGEPLGATGLVLHVLRAGMSFETSKVK